MPRCIHCKETFVKRYEKQMGKFRFCLAKEECIKAFREVLKVEEEKKREKEWKKRKTEKKVIVYAKEYKKQLQNQINLLARKIDNYFGYACIDCEKPFGKQTDGAHFHNVSGNENIRYNLHNIHAAKSDCNCYNSQHKVNYRSGLENRYGFDYLVFVDIELPKKYNYLGLKENDIFEALRIVRKINREFEKLVNQDYDGIQMRDHFNSMVGIYHESLN